MATQKYRITEKAGPFVAGTRNPGKGKTIQLSEEQARYPLIAGEIEEPGAAKAAEETPAGESGKSGRKAG